MEEQSEPIIPTVTEVLLTVEEHSAVTNHINRKAISPVDACPVCGSPDNSVLMETYRVNVLTEQPLTAGRHQPLVSTVCLGCGYVRFFNRLVVEQLIARHEDLEAERLEVDRLKSEASDGG